MPENEIRRCQVEMHGGNLCGRELHDDEHCICHSEDPSKDMEEFRAEVEKELRRENYYDFTGFVFPLNFQFRNDRFEKVVFFGRSQFWGDAALGNMSYFQKADFNHAIFAGEARFLGATFFGEADFEFATFSGEADFNHVSFSGDTVFVLTTFTGGTNFIEATFSGKTRFLRTTFSNDVRFKKTTFSGEVIFSLTTFSGEADFGSTTFFGRAIFLSNTFSSRAGFNEAAFLDTVSFRLCQFAGLVDFYDATFRGDADFTGVGFSSVANFQECMIQEKSTILFDQGYIGEKGFSGLADFREMRLQVGAKINFRHANLRECRFLMTDVTAFEFTDVKWPRTKGGKFFKRFGVYDEIAPEFSVNPQHDLLAQLYRRLQANYINNYRFSEASDFYIGEQEMMRKAKGRIRQYISVNMMYKLISHYGENYWMPLIYIGLVLLIFPMIFLMTGIDLSSHIDKAAGGTNIVNYNFGFTLPGWAFVSDYAKTFSLNFGYATFNRSEMAGRMHEWYQTLLINLEVLKIIVLVSFFVLALRRKFKRKSF